MGANYNLGHDWYFKAFNSKKTTLLSFIENL